ncbi:MAG TPA: hypothetical protein VFD37_06410 [Solirubrobacterales bacterium]|nr:hypothetical protein [Solirubrobacterales bacterium]
MIILQAPRQIPCARVSTLMTRFLQHTGGTLPGAWVVDAQRGAFTRGQGKRTGFWLTPVR